MKKILTAIIVTVLLAIPSVALNKKDKAAKPSSLEVSFNYQRQAGPGSNQYAVWIENEKGEVVKTLFVTSFRVTCITAWINRKS